MLHCLSQFNFWQFLINFKNLNGKDVVTCCPTIEFLESHCKCIILRFYFFITCIIEPPIRLDKGLTGLLEGLCGTVQHCKVHSC